MNVRRKITRARKRTTTTNDKFRTQTLQGIGVVLQGAIPEIGSLSTKAPLVMFTDKMQAIKGL